MKVDDLIKQCLQYQIIVAWNYKKGLDHRSLIEPLLKITFSQIYYSSF